MAALLKVLNNLADIKPAGGVALHVRTQAPFASQCFFRIESLLATTTTDASSTHSAKSAQGRPSLGSGKDPAICILIEKLRFHVTAFNNGGFELSPGHRSEGLERPPFAHQ
jgi:hypothetical protein